MKISHPEGTARAGRAWGPLEASRPTARPETPGRVPPLGMLSVGKWPNGGRQKTEPGSRGDSTELPGRAMPKAEGLEALRQPGPVHQSHLNPQSNGKKTQELAGGGGGGQLTEGTTQSRREGSRKGACSRHGGKKQQLVSQVKTTKTAPRCLQPPGSATSAGTRRLRAENAGK